MNRYHQLLASKNIRSDAEGYVSFDLTEGVKEWLKKSASNENSLDLSIHVDTPEIADTREPFPAAITFDVPSDDEGDEHNARLLVQRLNDIERTEPQDELFRRRKRQTVEGVNSEYCFNNPNETNCCIRKVSVNFHEDLGWDFVLHPESFEPNYCNGQCVDRLWPKATTSTRFLSQLRESNPTAAPEPCCVPHEMRSLSILVIVDGVVSRQTIPNMITESCICS